MKRQYAFSLFILIIVTHSSVFCQSTQHPGIYNIRSFGALGDGKNLDSKAINKAIETAANAGGGTVYLPAGNYLSGSIHLKSNVSLYLDQGATVIATSENPGEVYDQQEQTANTSYQDSGHSHFHNALLWGENLHDVSIL